jgi:ketosteroid isomerase-like protein
MGMRRPISVVVITAGLAACTTPIIAFSPEDEAAVRALEDAYRSGWEANDSAAVMSTLAPGAVLMPAGMEPIVGDSAIRAFWWPDDGSSTTVDGYALTVDEVGGAGDVAYVRGRGSLAFRYRDPTGQESALTSEAIHLSVAHRGRDGEWRIARRAWSAIR